MLAGGLAADSTGAGVNSKEINELREKLMISENLMTEMTKSWEQRLQETARIHQVG